MCGVIGVSTPGVLPSTSTTPGNGFPSSAVWLGLRRPGPLVRLNSPQIRSSKRVSLRVDGSFGGTLCGSSGFAYQSRQLKEAGNGGPPRWFSPLECGRRSAGSPLLLFLPGIDGDGLGLQLHHKKLGQIFNIWCLHIPVLDRTPLADLVTLVENTIRSEHEQAASRPIYLVGESFGASLALVVAAQNPDIDLVLILANPATNFSKNLLQNAAPLLDLMYKHMQAELLMSLIPVQTGLWKLRMIHEMQILLDSHLHEAKAQTLILASGKDMLLFRLTEGERLRGILKRCDIRSFVGKADPLLLDDTFDLVATIKRTAYYRRGASINYVSDFLLPTPSEYKTTYEQFRWMDVALNPVMFSTMDDGRVVRGLTGIPLEGPVLLVGNHMMAGIETVPIMPRFWYDRNILIRGMAHPVFFSRWKGRKFPDMSPLYDWMRHFGGVPVSATNLYKLLALKSHVLLYPGGAREVFRHKGEEYKLIWPDEPEFVRMAARFGTKIVPFGAVGEDDILELLLDSNDQMQIPPLKTFIEELNSKAIRLRSNAEGEVGKQVLYFPVCLPKLPGRLYYLFGQPISTDGRGDILQDKAKAEEMYVKIKGEIYKCISYLKEKREKDPYRSLLSRLPYQGYHGIDSQVPTFEI